MYRATHQHWETEPGCPTKARGIREVVLATHCEAWNPQRGLLCADQLAGSGSKSQKSCLAFSIQGPCGTAVLVGVLLGLSSLVFWVFFFQLESSGEQRPLALASTFSGDPWWVHTPGEPHEGTTNHEEWVGQQDPKPESTSLCLPPPTTLLLCPPPDDASVEERDSFCLQSTAKEMRPARVHSLKLSRQALSLR